MSGRLAFRKVLPPPPAPGASKLNAALDALVGKDEKGTTFGNIVFDRHL